MPVKNVNMETDIDGMGGGHAGPVLVPRASVTDDAFMVLQALMTPAAL